jgi:hypothetical protein
MNKVFEVLDKEQAAMYRWIRDTMDQKALERLIRKPVWSAAGCLDTDTLSRDTLLREAFHQYEAKTSGPKVAASAQLRVGILPSALGRALALYTDAAVDAATFEEGLSGVTIRDKDIALAEALRDLTDEILKLQR